MKGGAIGTQHCTQLLVSMTQNNDWRTKTNLMVSSNFEEFNYLSGDINPISHCYLSMQKH